MSDLSQWSTTAGDNNSASPDGFPEGMAPSGVNDSAREVMRALAALYADIDGTLISGGSSNAYTLTTNQTHAALADMCITAFRANHANTGAATLNVDSLGAKSIKKLHAAALEAGDIEANQLVVVMYNATDDAYELITTPSMPYDMAFVAGYTSSFSAKDLVVQTYNKITINRSGTFTGEQANLTTAPTGAALIVDIEKNGTTIYTTKPQFAISSTTLTAGTIKTDGTEDFVAGDEITFKVTQIGSTEPGEGLTFTATSRLT